MPVFESSRKVQVMGSSLAMTLPALFVKANEIEKGCEVYVIFGLDGVLVLSRWGDYEVTRKCLMDILEDIDEKARALDKSSEDEVP